MAKVQFNNKIQDKVLPKNFKFSLTQNFSSLNGHFRPSPFICIVLSVAPRNLASSNLACPADPLVGAPLPQPTADHHSHHHNAFTGKPYSKTRYIFTD